MSRTLRKYEPAIEEAKDSRKFKGVDKKHGIVYGADGMIPTHSESCGERNLKRRIHKKDRKEAKKEFSEE